MDLLIVEDERSLADDICAYLGREDMRCHMAGTVHEALDKLVDRTYACIILDLTLPDGNGLEVLRELKRMQRTDGVVIVSAKDALDDRLEGLRIGADDYITKPFHLAELAVRVQATVRRAHFGGQDRVPIGDLVLDLSGHSVSNAQGTITLTPTEFRLLTLLVASRERVLSRSTIAGHLTGEDSDPEDHAELVYAHMKNLKRKLAAAGSSVAIRTVYGIGYSLSASA
jgi:DNA-binding response OmpR family regulator